MYIINASLVYGEWKVSLDARHRLPVMPYFFTTWDAERVPSQNMRVTAVAKLANAMLAWGYVQVLPALVGCVQGQLDGRTSPAICLRCGMPPDADACINSAPTVVNAMHLMNDDFTSTNRT